LKGNSANYFALPEFSEVRRHKYPLALKDTPYGGCARARRGPSFLPRETKHAAQKGEDNHLMSAQENKEKARRLMEEAFGQGKTEVLDEVLHSEFVCYDPNSESGEIRGADTMKGEIEYFRQAVPDLTYTVEDQVAEGEEVVTRWRASGTHQGEFFGVAGTGNRIEMSGIQIDRFDESGKMIEEWPEYDLLGAMRQMGAIPES
jgi:predicted ester cyclase